MGVSGFGLFNIVMFSHNSVPFGPVGTCLEALYLVANGQPDALRNKSKVILYCHCYDNTYQLTTIK